MDERRLRHCITTIIQSRVGPAWNDDHSGALVYRSETRLFYVLICPNDVVATARISTTLPRSIIDRAVILEAGPYRLSPMPPSIRGPVCAGLLWDDCQVALGVELGNTEIGFRSGRKSLAVAPEHARLPGADIIIGQSMLLQELSENDEFLQDDVENIIAAAEGEAPKG